MSLKVGKDGHILSASSSLLGIALLVITGLHLTNHSQQTFADEIASAAALFLAASCLFSYLSIRAGDKASRFEAWADGIFICGLLTLFGAVMVFAYYS